MLKKYLIILMKKNLHALNIEMNMSSFPHLSSRISSRLTLSAQFLLLFALLLLLTLPYPSSSASDATATYEVVSPSRDALKAVFTGTNAKYLDTFDWKLGGSWLFDIQLARDTSYPSIAKAPMKEDIYAYEHWYYGLKNGIVVEVGSGDGVGASASYFFEKVPSWVAINIEKSGADFEKLKVNRPNAYNINADASKFSASGQELRDITALLKLRHIDVCFLKADGNELGALQSLSIEYTHVNAFVISCTQKDQQAIFSHLSKYDYDCVNANNLCLCMNKWYRPTAKKNVIV